MVLDDPRSIWDLGCGTGDLTVLLAERWPDAAVTGLDSSEHMLARARTHQGVEWRLGDIASWTPDEPTDLIFSTAALHWVDEHAALLPRLVEGLVPGGTLAIQMPRNFGEPSHALLYQLAGSNRWSSRLAHLIRPVPVADPEWYHQLLRPLVDTVDIWETIYLQTLAGVNPVAEWTRGTAALPFLEALADDAAGFMAEYARRLAAAYPMEDDGTTLFPFRRLFILARR